MPSVEDSAHLASDAELITSVRAGDRQAFGDLYSRHASAAAALARQFARSPAEADDLVSEAFARVLDGLLEGKGPDTAFRAYLFTTVRNTAYDRTRKDKRLQFTDDIESHDQPVELDDPVIADLENGLVGRAFAGLPERWQTVLWHVQVEGQSPAEVGVLMGMAPNAVSSLAFRAREGLREAYLQAHLAETAAQQCRTTVDRLGAWTRGGLSKRERAQVDAHLQVCDRCPALAAELSEINTGLRGLLAPLLLGGAAAGYIATLGPIAPLVQLGTFTGGATVAGSSRVAASHGSSTGTKTAAGKVFGGKAGLALANVGPWAPAAALAGAAAVTAGLVAAVIIALSGGSTAPAVAGSQAPVAGSTVGAGDTTVGGQAGGGGGGGGGSGGGGGGGNGGGGSDGSQVAPVIPGTTGTTAGTTATGSTTASGAPSSGPNAGSGPNPATPTADSTVPGGAPSGGNGTNGPGSNGPGSTGPDGLGTDGLGTNGLGPNGLGTAGLGTGVPLPSATDGQSIPGQPSNASSTPGAPNSTDGAATASTTDGVTASTSDAVSTTGQNSTSTATTSSDSAPVVPTTPTAPTTPTGPTTPTVPTTGPSSPTGPTTATGPTTPTVPTTATSSTPGTPTTTPTTPTTSIPPAPALLSVSASAASDAVAGSSLAVSVTVANTGGTASTDGQSVGIQVPTGLTIGAVTLASPLRTPHAFAAAMPRAFAAAAPGCTQLGTDVTCQLPPIAPQASFLLTVTLDISPDATDGDILIALNGMASPVQRIPLTVQSGYSAIRLSSAGNLPLAPAAVNTVTLLAAPKPGVRNPGSLTLAGSDFTVTGVSGDGGSCTVAAGAISCPAAAAQAGVTLDLAVTASATAPPVLTATDQRGRTVVADTDLTVDRSGVGGYRSVLIGDAGHLLRAGSVDTVTMTATTLNTGVVNAGPITVPAQLSGGVRIAAHPGSALPAGCQASTDTVTCTPADGAGVEFVLPIQVSAAATGAQQLADAMLPAGTANLTDDADPLTVDPATSGYDQITLTAASPLTAGSMAALTLNAVVGDRVTEPGPVRIARQLAPGLLVTSATGCDRDGEEFRCPPAGSAPAPTLTVAVLPLATAETVLAPAGLDGDREQDIAGSLAVAPRAPGQRIQLTGPFGGTSVGAPTMRCETTGVPARNGCPGGMTIIPNSSATLTVPVGATVISAELTWAATAPAANPASTLDTVDVSIDGRTGTIHGVRPAGVGADATGADPVSSGRLFQRVATADAQQLLAANASPGTHTVTISKLAAKTTGAAISAMGAWSLTVLWSTSSAPDVGIISDNRGLFSSSTRAGTVTVIEPAGKPVTAIYQTIWAADPWGLKTLAIGDVPLSTTINGRHGSKLDGFDLLHPGLPEGGLPGPITLINQLTPPAALNPDGLWIGPSLIVTAP